MVNNRINELSEQLKQELVKNWNKFSEETKDEINHLIIVADYKNEVIDLIIRVKELEQEKNELKKNLLAELAGGVHETYEKLIAEKEQEIKNLKEDRHSSNEFIVSQNQDNSKLKEMLKEKEVIIKDLEDEKKGLEDSLQTEQEQFQFYQDKAVEYQKKRENKIKELEWDVYLNAKTLPNLPQVKKEGKIKIFKKELVNKVNKMFRWKERKQETQHIAQIEVKPKS